MFKEKSQLGYQGDFDKIKMKSWRNAASPLANMAIPNSYLAKLGLFDLTGIKPGILVREQRGNQA